MKKTMGIILSALLLTVCLAGCGEADEAELHLEPLTPVTAEPSPLPQDEASPADAGEEAAAETAVADERLEAAQACVGQSVEALYEAVGEPLDAQYASSCNSEEPAEDGMLTYDGFSVWTLRTADEETVRAIYPDGE